MGGTSHPASARITRSPVVVAQQGEDVRRDGRWQVGEGAPGRWGCCTLPLHLKQVNECARISTRLQIIVFSMCLPLLSPGAQRINYIPHFLMSYPNRLTQVHQGYSFSYSATQ